MASKARQRILFGQPAPNTVSDSQCWRLPIWEEEWEHLSLTDAQLNKLVASGQFEEVTKDG